MCGSRTLAAQGEGGRRAASHPSRSPQHISRAEEPGQEAGRAPTVPPTLPPPREPGDCSQPFLQGKSPRGPGTVGAGWALPPGCGPFCLRQVGCAGRPVSCERGREESELGRPGDGWKLLLGGAPLQQEQGECHGAWRGLRGRRSAAWVRWARSARLRPRTALPRPRPLAQD